MVSIATLAVAAALVCVMMSAVSAMPTTSSLFASSASCSGAAQTFPGVASACSSFDTTSAIATCNGTHVRMMSNSSDTLYSMIVFPAQL